MFSELRTYDGNTASVQVGAGVIIVADGYWDEAWDIPPKGKGHLQMNFSVEGKTITFDEVKCSSSEADLTGAHYDFTVTATEIVLYGTGPGAAWTGAFTKM